MKSLEWIAADERKRCRHPRSHLYYALILLPARPGVPMRYQDMQVRVCASCAARVSLGPSNDSIPAAELRLARALADNVVLYEPGTQRAAADHAWVMWAVGR